MSPEENAEYAKYRLESAFDTLEAAKVLAENESWNSAVNRLYYAAFYAVNALLVINDIHTKSHSATKSQFSMHFVKTGKFNKEYGHLLSSLFDWRQKGDYENIFNFDNQKVMPLFQPVEEFIKRIEAEIDKVT